MKKQQSTGPRREERDQTLAPSSASSQVRLRVDVPLGRVLLIDDNLALRATTAQMLHSHGFDVVEAESGEAAVAFYRSLTAAIDVILLDMQMPGMDGLETYRALKAICGTVKVVLYSGAGRSERVEQGLREGALFFLPKPFTLDDLTAVVDRVAAQAPPTAM